MSRKKLNGLIYRMSNEIKGKQLAQAFKMLKSNGLEIRIIDVDGKKHNSQQKDKERNSKRINVQLVNGCVNKCWIG